MSALWWILGGLAICALAFFFRKATKNTPMENVRACTPNVEGMRWMESSKETKKKKETLW